MATSRAPADQTLRVWARRDVSSQTLQTTHLNGPPKRCIQHRRALALPSGEVLWDAPFSDAQDGLPISPVRTDMVTELWYEPETQWPHQSNLVITPDGIAQQQDHRRHQRKEGTFRSPLYQIVGHIYGLASAPKTWTNHVTKTLLSAGFRQHSLDKMLFVLYAKLTSAEHETLVAALIAYVDDFLLVHNERWDRNALTSLFEWGSKEVPALDNSIVFKGKELSLRQHGNQTYLALTQKAFIEGMKVGSVQCEKRLTENPPRGPARTAIRRRMLAVVIGSNPT